MGNFKFNFVHLLAIVSLLILSGCQKVLSDTKPIATKTIVLLGFNSDKSALNFNVKNNRQSPICIYNEFEYSFKFFTEEDRLIEPKQGYIDEYIGVPISIDPGHTQSYKFPSEYFLFDEYRVPTFLEYELQVFDCKKILANDPIGMSEYIRFLDAYERSQELTFEVVRAKVKL